MICVVLTEDNVDLEGSKATNLIIAKGIFAEDVPRNDRIRDDYKCLGSKSQLVNRTVLQRDSGAKT